jgi:uncharacterized RDD family membrane protein YckC
MGTVYLARDLSLDRPVAIKVLPAEVASKTEAQERFIREAQAQARLSSPHVVQIYFIGHAAAASGKLLYFAMELVLGGSLDALLERGERLDPEEARRFMIQVSRGLRDAHRAGIVHRDIKPGNLLCDQNRDLKIADFGLAKPRDPNLGLTREGAVMGTPLYMAPEQALGEALDHRADMYALGCSFYHLLTGAPPFDGPNAVSLIAKHLNAPPTPLRERIPSVPPKLAAIIERLMAKPRAARFATYEELIAALEAAAPERVEYAGFWTRGIALTIDFAVASLLIALLSWPGLLLHIAYVTLAHAYLGQTLAKYALRIQVQHKDGARLGVARSLLRTIAVLWLPFLMGLVILSTQGFSGLTESITQLARLSGVRALLVPVIGSYLLLVLLYGTGFVIAALDLKKRAVHDRIAGSRVVYRLGPRVLRIQAG